MLIQRKRVFSLMLALLLSLTVQRPALATLDPSDAGAVTVREWAAMLLCTFGDDEGNWADQDCLVEAYRRGWLSLSGVLAPDAALCRGALYESAFAAGDLPVYDWSLYPGGTPLSDYENCQRALEIGNATSAVKNTIPGDLPSSDLNEIENVIRGHKAVGPQLEMNR